MIIWTYFLLLTITYPYVCWTKHRPSDDDYYISPPRATVINKPPAIVCSQKYQFNLMPMPSKIILSNKTKIIRIPSIIRIETKLSLPFPIPKSSPKASFILYIDCPSYIKNNSYPNLGIDESYQLNITSHHRASLFANTYVGIIRGLSTFEQLQHQELVIIPLSIFDKPQFIWRGLMLDVARHFIPVSIIKQTIDYMQLVKMNVLHLHLSDDQGFRLESKVFPRLHDSHQFYSQSDIRNLIEYARQRAIRILPELDMPAHTASWFVGYPYLSSSQKKSYKLEKIWGIHNATIDVTLQSTYDFLEKLFFEMTQLFPDEFFHIGGDECVPYEWIQSEHIQKFIEEKKLYDHQGLQAYFTRRLEKILNKNNRKYGSSSHFKINSLSNKDDEFTYIRISNVCVDKKIHLHI
jgi:hexosaminidase